MRFWRPGQQLGTDEPFAVSNADDVYSEAAMALLAQQLGSGLEEHVLIGYQLQATVATDEPVTRGICQVDDRGYLTALTERRQIVRQGTGRLRSEDGEDPVELNGELPTSVNLWGFQPRIWELFGLCDGPLWARRGRSARQSGLGWGHPEDRSAAP